MPDADDKKRRAQRNVAIALMVAAFVLIVYLVTILKIGGSIAERTF